MMKKIGEILNEYSKKRVISGLSILTNGINVKKYPGITYSICRCIFYIVSEESISLKER
jgi:hypothetical protein